MTGVDSPNGNDSSIRPGVRAGCSSTASCGRALGSVRSLGVNTGSTVNSGAGMFAADRFAGSAGIGFGSTSSTTVPTAVLNDDTAKLDSLCDLASSTATATSRDSRVNAEILKTFVRTESFPFRHGEVACHTRRCRATCACGLIWRGIEISHGKSGPKAI
jgi:hypothetical protein